MAALMLRAVADPAVNVLEAVFAVTPEGAPETVKVIGPLKVPCTEPHDT